MTETRKLAAILAADVVGYSRLMGEDEAGTARAVREHREAAAPLVASKGGRIVKTTGDGLLIEFPSVVAAVECAIAIQKLMTERNAGTPEDQAHPLSHRRQPRRRARSRTTTSLATASTSLRGSKAFASPAAFSFRAPPTNTCGAGSRRTSSISARRTSRTSPGRCGSTRSESGSEGAASAPSASAPNEQEPPRLSIVVLPFANLGGDPEQEHFVDGVTDSLTTDLSRIGGSFVIGRNTAFTYKGRRVDLKQIGRELNIRYILEGSVQRAEPGCASMSS